MPVDLGGLLGTEFIQIFWQNLLGAVLGMLFFLFPGPTCCAASIALPLTIAQVSGLCPQCLIL